MQPFQKNRHFIFRVFVTLKLLILLISCIVAYSMRIVVDRQTDRQTHTRAWRHEGLEAGTVLQGMMYDALVQSMPGYVALVNLLCWSSGLSVGKHTHHRQ